MAEVTSAQRPRIRERAFLEWLSDRAGRRVRVHDWKRLAGGAIQENWKLTLSFESPSEVWRDGKYVLRTDSQSAVAASLGRAAEFDVLRAGAQAGVPCPEPLALLEDETIAGASLFLMRWCPGVAAGHRLVRDDVLVPDRVALVRDIGQAMGRLHTLAPDETHIVALPQSPAPTRKLVAELRAYLDTLGAAFPVLELGLREVERRLPAAETVSLVHRDLRTGNYLVHEGRLSAVLDWEFAAWANPMEDLGWFTAKCWRFGEVDCEAGGVGPLAPFLEAYAQAGGVPVEPNALRFWQLIAHLRWAVIALQQVQRHLSGIESSLELALTGRVLPELELNVLNLLERL